jgi:hypothetical protein
LGVARARAQEGKGSRTSTIFAIFNDCRVLFRNAFGLDRNMSTAITRASATANPARRSGSIVVYARGSRGKCVASRTVLRFRLQLRYAVPSMLNGALLKQAGLLALVKCPGA